ncbi:MAG: UDP-2,3-diacylglucosamine diphosphatase [Gammaproteobacteria bacterium]|nr:UDP-2,3-diacylglucosamine diphosphatase [Gammaproteobacteria bacterium]MDE0714111.1 UDP-2,3-diacylglucosamine diphosphatase [Gammaproteobacteria bacterium]MXY66464.1 UDP-2,3-diacylglucosamine diphosphatase [Gammaproteobacteria bacterium]MYG66685.1 UDP-2,3-diacylglucosamine diphosphatase [Gammaproteobacteria bacterium]MYH90529.1 UDP-2,3-diacylglucosamine diphosphatase [Gammaproteobacteria bacterium]
MTIAFISDLHLTPERPESKRLFERFIIDAHRYITRLYILGDLFEYWVGDDGADTLGHLDAEAAIRRAVDTGVEVLFLHGNRDFLIGNAFAERTGCRLLPDPVVITHDGLRILLTHGDALCTDDVEHQASRRQMLSGKWKLAFLEQPLARRMETADAMRRRSEREKREKPMEIMDVNQDAVEALMREHDVRILIHGHTHKPAAHEFEIDGELARRYVLGDWYEQKSALYLDNGHLVLQR